MTKKRDIDVEISAWLDGELDREKSEEIRVAVESDPDLESGIQRIQATGMLLRKEVDEAESRMDFTDFSSNVLSALESEAPKSLKNIDSTVQPDEKIEKNLWQRFAGWLAGTYASNKTALAAAATALVLIGGGTMVYMFSEVDAEVSEPLVLRGGATVIEDLHLGDGSAVVYRTDSEMTVIWVTEG